MPSSAPSIDPEDSLGTIDHLCEAVRVIEGVRGRRHDPEQALDLWQALRATLQQ